MPLPGSEKRKLLQEIELVLQYLSQPENLTSPDSEYIRAIVAQKALEDVHQIIEQDPSD